MRAIPRAPEHEVKLSRPDGDVTVRLKAPPLAHRPMIERHFTAPVRFVNGVEKDDPAAQSEYAVLLGFVLLADVLTGDDKPQTPRPSPTADRAAWDRYARALREEFESAGYCEGDISALVRGYNTVSVGKGAEVGKPGAPSSTPSGA